MHIHLSTRVMFLQSLIKSRLTYGCHTWRPTHMEISKIESTYRYFLRCMVWNGHARVNPPTRNPSNNSSDESEEEENIDWSYIIPNEKLYQITGTSTITNFYKQRQINQMAHLIRRENNNVCKILTFHTAKRTKLGRKNLSILERAVQHSGLSHGQFLKDSFMKNNRQVSVSDAAR